MLACQTQMPFETLRVEGPHAGRHVRRSEQLGHAVRPCGVQHGLHLLLAARAVIHAVNEVRMNITEAHLRFTGLSAELLARGDDLFSSSYAFE